VNWFIRLLLPSRRCIGGGGGFDLADPLNLSGGNKSYDKVKQLAVDPLHLFYSPPGAPGDPAGDAARAEEARKDALRARIDKLYGIGPQQPIYGDPQSGGGSVLMRAARLAGPPVVGYQDDPEVVAAQKQMADEQKQLADSTRGYYTDQLARSFGAAERNTRFNLARQGLMGGSADVDANRELQTDQNLGATRIDEAARRAVAQLQTQREQERLNATNLVNAGAGEDAVISAQAGLKNSLENVSTAQKANIFGDLFSTGADAFASQNYNQALAAQLARYQSSLGAFSRPARAAASLPRAAEICGPHS
jgi:hypothetical protein